jgi:hypothetical protein
MSIATMLVLTMIGVGTAQPPWAPSGPLVYVDPWLVTAEVGETFEVYVEAKDFAHGDPEHEALFLSDFEMTFDASVLGIVDDPETSDIEGIDISDKPNSFEVIYTEMMWLEVTPARTWMKIKVVSGRPVGVKEGLDGTVGLAKLTFVVKGNAEVGTVEGTLKIYFSDLICVQGHHIGHKVSDGMFATSYPTLWAKKKGAHGTGIWTEWRSAAYYVGLTNTINAKIVNTGTQGATARMIFKVERPDAMTDEIASAPVFIPAGGAGTFSVSYALPATGRYAVTGFIEYEIVPFRWISWEAVQPVLGGLANTWDTGNAFRAK